MVICGELRRYWLKKRQRRPRVSTRQSCNFQIIMTILCFLDFIFSQEVVVHGSKTPSLINSCVTAQSIKDSRNDNRILNAFNCLPKLKNYKERIKEGKATREEFTPIPAATVTDALSSDAPVNGRRVKSHSSDTAPHFKILQKSEWVQAGGQREKHPSHPQIWMCSRSQWREIRWLKLANLQRQQLRRNASTQTLVLYAIPPPSMDSILHFFSLPTKSLLRLNSSCGQRPRPTTMRMQMTTREKTKSYLNRCRIY